MAERRREKEEFFCRGKLRKRQTPVTETERVHSFIKGRWNTLISLAQGRQDSSNHPNDVPRKTGMSKASHDTKQLD